MDTAVENRLQRHVVFRLGDELFAVDIKRVKEITMPVHITRVPKVPHYIDGVINLRGKIVPVLNLRKRFNLPEGENARERFLVLEYRGSMVGMIVDGVDEVLEFSAEEVLPPPLLSQTFNREFLEGIVKRQSDIVILLSIDRLLDREIEGLKGGLH